MNLHDCRKLPLAEQVSGCSLPHLRRSMVSPGHRLGMIPGAERTGLQRPVDYTECPQVINQLSHAEAARVILPGSRSPASSFASLGRRS